MDEVDFTILAAKSVFSDLIDKCPPAETCRDAFDRTAKATIKMANSTGGFGAAPRTYQNREAQMDWSSTSDVASTGSGRRIRHQQKPSQQSPFQFDISLSDALSSPAMSNAGEVPSRSSPPLPKVKSFESSNFGQKQTRSAPSPSEMGLSATSDSTVLDQTLIPSPTLSRRLTTSSSATTGHTFMTQPDFSAGSMEYPDLQTMEFLQGLQGTPNGELGSLDQGQLDLGFGINWDGMHHDFSEGQQVNILDGFFFGGPQSGMNGGGMGGGMGGGGGL
jgi:hypothetical protein